MAGSTLQNKIVKSRRHGMKQVPEARPQQHPKLCYAGICSLLHTRLTYTDHVLASRPINSPKHTVLLTALHHRLCQAVLPKLC